MFNQLKMIGLLTLSLLLACQKIPDIKPPGTGNTTPPGPPGTANTFIVGSDPLNTNSSTGNIYVIKPDGTGKKYLTKDTNVKNALASWSYDGTKIVYMSNRGDGVNGNIWIMDSNGGNNKQLTFSGAITSAFSPDGKKIVYSGTKTGHPEVWVMNSDGTNQKQITNTTVSSPTRTHGNILWSIHPSFSPDGSKIVYASTQSGHSEIWVMNANGTGQTQLTFPNNLTFPDANAPSWSPDGKRVAFWSGYETEYGELWVMNADGTGRKQLTFEGIVDVNSDNPNWSPDGKYIIFESNRQPNPHQNGAQTWLMDADGSNPKILFDFAYGAGRRPWINQFSP